MLQVATASCVDVRNEKHGQMTFKESYSGKKGLEDRSLILVE
jgi:hypothetical protein